MTEPYTILIVGIVLGFVSGVVFSVWLENINQQ